MKTVLYKSIDKEILDEWEQLWKESPDGNYINSPYWFVSVIESFNYKNFVLIAIYENGKLIAIGSLVNRKKYGLDFYTVAPEDFVCGIPFLIDLTNTEVVKELTQQLLDLGNILFTNVSEKFIYALKVHTEKIDTLYQAPNYYLALTKNENGNIFLRKRNKLIHEIKGNEEKFILQPFNGESSKNLDLIFDLDNKSSKYGKGYNTFSSSSIKKFYKTLAKHFGKYFCFNILYFEKFPIAYEIGFLIDRKYFGSQMAYLSEYKQYSPGKVIFVKVADFLGSKGVRQWDMGSGESSVKKLVTEEKRELYQIILSKNIFVRAYITSMSTFKNFAFDQLHQYVKIYSVYKKIKKAI